MAWKAQEERVVSALQAATVLSLRQSSHHYIIHNFTVSVHGLKHTHTNTQHACTNTRALPAHIHTLPENRVNRCLWLLLNSLAPNQLPHWDSLSASTLSACQIGLLPLSHANTHTESLNTSLAEQHSAKWVSLTEQSEREYLQLMCYMFFLSIFCRFKNHISNFSSVLVLVSPSMSSSHFVSVWYFFDALKFFHFLDFPTSFLKVIKSVFWLEDWLIWNWIWMI